MPIRLALLARLTTAFLLACAAPTEASAREGGLLIVAPAAFRAALDPYVAQRRASLPVDIVNLEDALAGAPGVDDPSKLKRFLYERWRNDSVRYVLLVGDADVMPVRYMVLDRVTEPAFDYAFYPSDLYYADLAQPDGAFEDWNAQRADFHAGYFGEVRGEKNKSDAINFDDVDYRPDIALGRWPVSTPEEARLVAEKSMAYERALEAKRKNASEDAPPHAAAGAHAPARSTAALIACGGWIENRPAMDAVAARLGGSWTIEKRYYSDAQRADGTPPPDEGQLIELLNSGCALVLHSGHGGDDRWEGSLSVNSIARLTNGDRLPVVLSSGCSTARFATLPPYEGYVDISGTEHQGTNSGEIFTSPPPPPAPYQRGVHNGTGLGEQLLRASPNGAVAYIGCNTGSQPCGMTLLAGFVDALGSAAAEPGAARPRLGDCWAHAVSYYYERERLADLTPTESWYPASIFFQGMKFMLFGDPSLPMP